MKRIGLMLALAVGLIAGAAHAADVTILNVSYDPTRELYKAINAAFIPQWKAKTGDTLTINQSHGGSGQQSRAVIDGLDADVVTLGLAYDIDAIADKAKLLPDNWQKRLPNNSTPYTSTIVFLVRAGNPKGIHDWPDLTKEGVQIITPNPKTSGGAKLNLLAAWGAVLRQHGIDEKSTPEQRAAAEKEARKFVAQLYQHCPVLDSGARGSTITFARRQIGDVHLTWENEARLEVDETGDLEIVYPSSSIKAEPEVAVVDQNVDRKGTREIAEAYLKFLYTEKAQEIIVNNGYRPTNAAVAEKFKDRFPDMPLFRIDYVDRGGWDAAQRRFFADGGVFDQIYQPSGED
jgi:sulfate transport system substrate-binding protein